MVFVVIVFFSVLVQSVAGFGLALCAMPFAIGVLGYRNAAPAISLVAITTQTLLIIKYRHSFRLGAVWRLLVGSSLGIPIGVFFVRELPESFILGLLGVVLIVYSTHALTRPNLPKIKDERWGFLFGFGGGTLGGAYNTSGPPVIIYGDCQRWEPTRFKANLQAFFVLNTSMVVTVHFLGGNISGDVLMSYLNALPAILIGVVLGVSLDRFINRELFRRLVLWLLIFLGLRLLWSAVTALIQ